MIQNLMKSAQDKMDKSSESLKNDLSKIRTGRAHPSLLSGITVDYYGTQTPLAQVASVAVDGARTLTVTPWEKTMIAPIEKAIMKSDLGLNPATAGMVIRIPLPPLTEERRKELAKIVKDATEKARVGVRQARRDFNNACKDLLKQKEITEDDLRRAEQDIQKLTDKEIKTLDALCSEKEADLMSI